MEKNDVSDNEDTLDNELMFPDYKQEEPMEEPKEEPKVEVVPKKEKPNRRKVRSEKQIEAFKKAQEKRKANLAKKKQEKLAKQHEAYLAQKKSDPIDIPEPEPDQVTTTVGDEPIPKITRKKKPKKIVYVSESDNESSEEEVIVKRKKKTKKRVEESKPEPVNDLPYFEFI